MSTDVERSTREASHAPLDPAGWVRAHAFELWVVFGIWAGLTALIFFLATGHETPRRYQDEFLFWALAKNFAAGDGLTWRGVGIGMKSWLYPVLLAPAFWLSSSVAAAYTLVHLINSMMIVATIFLAFVLARAFVGRGLALVAALLTVSVPAMNYAGIVGTESLGYLTCTLAIGAIVLAAARPSLGNWLLAAATIAIAALTRTQFVLLLPILGATTLLVAAMRGPGGRLAYLREQRWLLAGLLTVAALGGLYILVKGKAAFGLYGGAFDGVPVTWEAMKYWLKGFSADVYLLCGIVPAIATFAMLGRAANRRDPMIGALLALALVMSIAFVLQISWFSATNPYDWRARHIFYERYMFYLGPIFFVGLVAAWRRVGFASAAISGAVAVLLVTGFQSDAVLVPFSYDSFGLSLVGKYLQTHADSEVVASIGRRLAIVTLLLALVYLVATLGRWRLSVVGFALSLVAVGGILVATQWQTWDYARTYSEQYFETLPKPLNFIDRSTEQDAAMLITSTDSPEMYFTSEFWNNRIVRAYGSDEAPISTPLMYSPRCTFSWDRAGTILGEDCDEVPQAWYVRNDNLSMHLQDESKREHPPGYPGMTLMETDFRPKIHSLTSGVNVNNGQMQGELRTRTFLAAPGRLRVRVRAIGQTVLVQIGDRLPESVPAGRVREFSFPLPRDEFETEIFVTTPAGSAAPAEIERLEVSEPGLGRRSLL